MQMRLRKLLLTLLLMAVLVLETVSLAWSAIEGDRKGIALYSIRVVLALYLVLVSAISVQQEYSAHWRSVVHISALTFTASMLLGTLAILPSRPMPVSATTVEPSSVVPQKLFYAITVLYVVACVVAATIPRAPPLHFPSERIYSEKTLMAITSKYEDNVCGSVSASVWDTLLFSYTTKVVMLGNTAESLEIGDLPIVPSDLRATFIFATMRSAMTKWKLKIFSWRPKPGSGWQLAYRILRCNQWTILLIIVLASVAAVLFYAPAFFLRQVVAYLEADPERKDRGWGWVFCAGLFFSNAISQLSKLFMSFRLSQPYSRNLTVTGQLWSLSTTTLQVRIRVQLNTILFAKTLVRKDVASASGSSSSASPDTAEASQAAHASEDAGDKKKLDEEEFSSKAQIMTLMTTDVDRVSEFAWHIFTLVGEYRIVLISQSAC
jgi:hypothetical protein